MWTEAERGEVFAALDSSVGPRVATLMTQAFPPVGWEELARRADLDDVVRRSDLEAQGVALRGEIAELRAELHVEVGALQNSVRELRSELKGDIAEVRGEIAEVRGEVAALSGRLDGLLGRQLLADVPLAFAVAGLVLAAFKLA